MQGYSDELTFTAELTNLSRIRQFVGHAMQCAGCPVDAEAQVKTAVDEACTNVILHGYRQSGGEITVHVDCSETGIEIRIEDTAPLYDPLTQSTRPDLHKPYEERPIGGLGVEMIRQSVDEALHQPTQTGGNRLILRKFCSQQPA